jgi:adenosylhomocysteinase
MSALSPTRSSQLELWNEKKGNWQVRLRKGLRAPQAFDEKVARLHLGALLAHASVLSDEQSEYIGIPVNGPYKPDTYRY